MFFNLIFLALTYGMTGLPAEYFRFGLFASVGLIVSFVAEGLGLAIGATFSITVTKLLGTFTIMIKPNINLLFVYRMEALLALYLSHHCSA